MTARRKDDDHEEDWEPVEAHKPPKASAVYSIRFTGTELAGLRSIARLERIRISDIVHRAIDLYLAADEAFTIRAGSPSGPGMTTYIYHARPGSNTMAPQGGLMQFSSAR
jgi:hypothetical protein